MTRSIPTALRDHIQTGSSKLAIGALVKRNDGLYLSLTSAADDAVLTGVPVGGTASGAILYRAAPGLEISSIRSSEGFNVDTLEATLLEGGPVTRSDILRGLWDGAAWTLFQYNWSNLSDGFYVLKSGWLGALQPRLGKFVTEMRDLRQPLQEEHSTVLQADCRYTLGDVRCTKSLAAFTDAITVATVTSNQVFSIVSARPDDFYGNGQITWLTGANVNVTVKVKSYSSATDTFTLAEPMLSAIQIGDTATAIAGCRKRRTEDCVAKFANVLNFGGEPDKPLVTKTMAEPEFD
jgi:uncharacterized phage protein (TIGR02218 family)